MTLKNKNKLAFIGNDIVSLSCPFNKKSFHSKKYLKKTFTEKELYFLTYHPETFLPQLLWSCKESAYKVLVKDGLNKAFSPALYSTQIVSQNSDSSEYLVRVKYRKKEVSVNSMINSSFIHSIATENSENVHNISYNIGYSESGNISELMHKSVINDIAARLNLPPGHFRIIKNDINQVPSLVNTHNHSRYEVSFSHDQNFYSYAYLL